MKVHEMTSSGTDEHWEEFGTHIYAGEVIHLVSKKTKSSGKKDAEATGSSGDKDPNKHVTILLLEQQLRPEVWNWSDVPALQAALTSAMARRDTVAIGCLIMTKLFMAGIEMSDFHIVIHDKDVTEHVWDDVAKCHRPVPKAPHIHVVGRYGKPKRGIAPVRVAEVLGVPAQMVEIPKDRFAYDNKMAYLIHFKDPNKHQYGSSDVVTLAGDSYEKHMMERLHAWEIGRAKKLQKIEDTTVDVDWLWEECFQGRITRENIELSDDLRRCYGLHEKKIDAALNSYSRKCMAVLVDKFDRGEFKTSFVYIQGPSRMGKSTLAKGVCDALRYRFGWEVDDLAATNSMDDYTGRDIILIDDASVAAMTGKAWLNLIDPNHAHPAPGRFRNKPRVAPRVIIITSTKDPIEFFYYAKSIGSDRGEAMTQFIARIMHSATVLDYRDMRGQYSIELGGTHLDPAFFNISVTRPTMLDKPVLEVAGMVGDKELMVDVSARLDVVTDESGAPVQYSPVGAVTYLTREIESMNADARATGDYEDLRNMVVDTYSSVVSDDVARHGSSNLMLPENVRLLPDSIAVSDTPPERMARDDASRKSAGPDESTYEGQMAIVDAAMATAEYRGALDEYRKVLSERDPLKSRLSRLKNRSGSALLFSPGAVRQREAEIARLERSLEEFPLPDYPDWRDYEQYVQF